MFELCNDNIKKMIYPENVAEADLGLKAVNYYHKALHLGCCNSPRSASDVVTINDK